MIFPRNAAMKGPTPAMRPTGPELKPYPKAGSEKRSETETERATTVNSNDIRIRERW